MGITSVRNNDRCKLLEHFFPTELTFNLDMDPWASLRPKHVLDARRDIYIGACDMLKKVDITTWGAYRNWFTPTSTPHLLFNSSSARPLYSSVCIPPSSTFLSSLPIYTWHLPANLISSYLWKKRIFGIIFHIISRLMTIILRLLKLNVGLWGDPGTGHLLETYKVDPIYPPRKSTHLSAAQSEKQPISCLNGSWLLSKDVEYILQICQGVSKYSPEPGYLGVEEEGLQL